jgi:hypothetical protein
MIFKCKQGGPVKSETSNKSVFFKIIFKFTFLLKTDNLNYRELKKVKCSKLSFYIFQLFFFSQKFPYVR